MEIKPNTGATKVRRRVGRGISSGLGKTCGRGHKGQRSRSGKRQPFTGFEGGQTPLYRRIPKRGFRSRRQSSPHGVNLIRLSGFDASEVITCELLRSKGLVPKTAKQVKILGSGEIKTALTFEVHSVSAGARKKLESAGCTIKIIDQEASSAE